MTYRPYPAKQETSTTIIRCTICGRNSLVVTPFPYPKARRCNGMLYLVYQDLISLRRGGREKFWVTFRFGRGQHLIYYLYLYYRRKTNGIFVLFLFIYSYIGFHAIVAGWNGLEIRLDAYSSVHLMLCYCYCYCDEYVPRFQLPRRRRCDIGNLCSYIVGGSGRGSDGCYWLF